jgi:photosystem II stability/assembly factor-like uncharacterized protein
MKASLLALLGLSLATGLTAQAQWVNQPLTFASPASQALHIEPVDANNVWVASDAFDVYVTPQLARTTDSGQTWTVRTLPLRTSQKEYVAGLSAISPSTAWLVSVPIDSLGSRIMRTTDGGQTWQTQGRGSAFTDPDSFAALVHFFSATEGVVAGQALAPGGNFEIFRTTDGGQNWTPVTAPATQGFEGISGQPAVVGNTIWFLTDAGRVFRSTDRGQSWTVSSLPTRVESTGLAFRDAQNGLLVSLDENGTNHTLFRTTDGGQTWSQAAYSGPLHGIGLSAVPGTNQYVSTGSDIGNGDQGSSYSRDNGQTWVALENSVNHFYTTFISPTSGWSTGVRPTGPTALGDGVNKFTSSVLGTRAAETAAQAGWQLAPNPADHGQTTLRATKAFGAAQVQVRDVTGRLVREYAWTGGTPLNLDLSQAGAGLYVVEVSTAAGRSHQKVQVR